jgi:pSer/pThr/pTyr-binding forkhead associated (FHA) protein
VKDRKMENTFGKLSLTLPEGLEQEFELGKPVITIGRAMTNDIVLGDARVSRNHARIECGSGGCTLIDLGSSNGTRLNGNRVVQANLTPGDVIDLGSSSLHYLEAAPVDESGMTIINSDADLEASLDQATIAVSLNNTSSPRLVVHTPERTWEISLDEFESIIIGRAASDEIYLDNPKVSRRHAQVMRKGDQFILRDLGSTNGTWVKDKRIEEHRLVNGDVFRIGGAQIFFKSGFTEEALTVFGDTGLHLPVRRPVVFVPGLMGSELWLGNERVWPNVKYLFKHPEIYQYSDNSSLQARALVGEVVIVPNLIKLEQYNRMGDYLVEDLGYERGVDFFEFAYDWRQDVRLSAKSLAQAIEAWGIKRPITLVAHSLGTLVSRYYVERLGGKALVERLILLGGPHQGTPTAASSLAIRPELLPLGLLGERLRKLIASFPSFYQILPTYPCAEDQHGNKINLLEDDSWLDPMQRPLLLAAREFRKELGNRSSVPAISIFGYGLKTVAGLTVQRNAQGGWQNIVYSTDMAGDSRIPEKSAVLEGSEIHPVAQYHGSLYVDNDVKMRLKLELIGNTPA